MDNVTSRAIDNASDEKAAESGMIYWPQRGEYACKWIEENCCLYEGERAGEKIELYKAQREFLMRLFSWVRWSEEWGEPQYIRRFNRAAFWAAKKNGKSPLAAAYNLYLMCADGELGNKVYMMAHDGKQARISQDHAVKMIDQSSNLSEDCKINRSTLDITHLPSGSKIIVVTGNDKRGAASKHGYNGSVTVDEMHVVTRPMMDAIGRAGISRREPLQVSLSTAGTDPSSVGFERCDYGRQVNSGQRNDPHFLHVEYTADEKATEADIDANLEKYGRASNPAWGTLIKPSEFRADWLASKGSPRKTAIFKQERLSIWVSSSSPWLDSRGWANGQRAYSLADLIGRYCFLGFDAARKLDMTAAVFVFPWPEDGPEAIRIWPMFWLPEETAKERDHLYPFQSWAESGDLTLTPGGTMDYGRVKSDIRRVVTENKLTVLNLYYDPAYANEITQALHEGERMGDASEYGCVAARTEVKQSMMGLTGLACEVERRVKAGLVQHPGNAVMTWQVGHCQVKRDNNQNIIPMKPEANSGKNIDGVAALVDAMPGVMKPVETSPISWM